MDELNKTLRELGVAFDQFKQTNDERLGKLEKGNGTADLEQKLDRISAEIAKLEDLKTRLEEVETKANRPGGFAQGAEKEYKEAFNAFIRKGDESALKTKAINVGTSADGGYAVPEELDRNIIQLERDMSPMRQVANVISVGTSDYRRLVNLGGAGSGWVGETAVRPETSTPTLAQIAPFMGEIYANPAITQNALDDVFFNAEGWLSDEVAREFAEKEGSAFLTGDGTNKPKGILAHTLSTSGDDTRVFGQIQKLHSGVAGDFDADDIISLIYSLKSGYRQNARFMMAGLTVAKIRKFKDSQGNYLWQPGLQAGQPSSILGHAIVENEDVPAVAADANAMLFGDFRRGYTVVDRIGTRVLRDPYTNKPYVHFYTTKRVGGMLADSQAIKVLTLSL